MPRHAAVFTAALSKVPHTANESRRRVGFSGRFRLCRCGLGRLLTLGAKAAQLRAVPAPRSLCRRLKQQAGKLGHWLVALGLSSLAFFEDSVL